MEDFMNDQQVEQGTEISLRDLYLIMKNNFLLILTFII